MRLIPSRSSKITAAANAVIGGDMVLSPGTSFGVSIARERAIAIPTISRARDLFAAYAAQLSIRQFGTQWDGEDLVEIPIPPEPWMSRPDSSSTLAATLAWTIDSMLFWGFSAWYVTGRYAPSNGDFPASFQLLPAEQLSFTAANYVGNTPIGPIENISFNGTPLSRRDVVFFWSPNEPLLRSGARAIRIAEKLDLAAERFATSPIAAGWLKQTGGEPLSREKAKEAAQTFAEQRLTDSIAFFPENIDWKESGMDPSKLQLTEARQHSALELSRVANISPLLTGAPSGSSMTYSNATQAWEQLGFDVAPYLAVIEQTLSSEQVTPRGRVVRLKVNTPAGAATPAQQPDQQGANAR